MKKLFRVEVGRVHYCFADDATDAERLALGDTHSQQEDALAALANADDHSYLEDGWLSNSKPIGSELCIKEHFDDLRTPFDWNRAGMIGTPDDTLDELMDADVDTGPRAVMFSKDRF